VGILLGGVTFVGRGANEIGVVEIARDEVEGVR